MYHRHSRDYADALKAFPRSRQASDDESSVLMSEMLLSAPVAAISLSAPIATLLIPSLKEVNPNDVISLAHVVL